MEKEKPHRGVEQRPFVNGMEHLRSEKVQLQHGGVQHVSQSYGKEDSMVNMDGEGRDVKLEGCIVIRSIKVRQSRPQCLGNTVMQAATIDSGELNGPRRYVDCGSG